MGGGPNNTAGDGLVQTGGQTLNKSEGMLTSFFNAIVNWADSHVPTTAELAAKADPNASQKLGNSVGGAATDQVKANVNTQTQILNSINSGPK
jgi:hypothetical protein